MEKIEIIKPGSIIDIQIGTPYYQRLQDLATYFTHTVAPEELAAQIKNIKNDIKLSEFGVHLETILILLNEIEIRAKEQDLVEEAVIGT